MMKLLVIGSGGRKRIRHSRRLPVFIGSALLLAMRFVALAADNNSPDILANLRPEHPRLILTTSDWNGLRARRTKDTELSAILNKTVAEARQLLSTSPVVYKKQGKRLLAVSREALRRIICWSFAYRVTGENVFLDRAQKEMLTVAAFKDWNPSHFLDTAEMTASLALGYDWLFGDLPEFVRAAIREAIIEKGLNPALDRKAKWNGWQHGQNNWNQVCFGGLTLGALAIAEDDPDLARRFLTLARKGNPNGLKPYAPDGIYPEGPGYWNYGTSYQVLMPSALQTALGTDWDLSVRPGFLGSAAVLVEQTGPTGRPFNFSDGHDGVAFNPALFWFAQKLHQPELVYFQNQVLLRKLATGRTGVEKDRFFPFLAVWTAGLPKKIPPPALPLAWHGDGPNPVGIFRSSWTDTNALFLAFKGGSARVNHGHMDAGSFVLDADGVRWAADLGAQDYLSVESKGWNLWSKDQHSDRWRVYRLNNFSHNTLTLDGQLHNVSGDARITTFTADSAAVDLSQIFAGQAGSVVRQFSFDAKQRKVVVRDKIASAKPGLAVRWQMVTHANISLQKGHATLRQDGKELTATILSPAGAQFEIASAQPPDDGVNQPNPNTRILAVNINVPTSGNLAIEIELRPSGGR
jgi:Heparinase II/III-like protein